MPIYTGNTSVNTAIAADRIKLPRGTSAPANPSTGDMYYNTSAAAVYLHNGSTFAIMKGFKDGSTSSLAASRPQDIRDLGITTAGLYYLDCGSLGTQQVYLVFDSFIGGTGVPNTTNAWGLVARWSSYQYDSYNTKSWLDSIATSTFGTRSTSGWWVNPSLSGRGWMSLVHSGGYVSYNDTTTGYYVTENTNGTFWQTSVLNTTSSGYPSNVMVNVNYNSYNGSTQVGACWCQSVGCTEHFDAGGNCSSTDIVRWDNHSGTSTVEIWLKG